MFNRYFIAITALMIAASVGFGPSPARAQTITGLETPPQDTADAQRVRIWFPRETAGRCRVTLDIVSDSGEVVRHLANFLAPKGYYNFYWDKRDDSGLRVPEGVYRYQLDNCGKKKFGTVEARYTKWERAVDFSPYDPSNPGELTITVAADSVPITLRICNQHGRPLDDVFVDSVFSKGSYPVRIDLAQHNLHFGNFELRFTAGDYVYVREVTFLP